jgi:hypothetical protein
MKLNATKAAAALLAVAMMVGCGSSAASTSQSASSEAASSEAASSETASSEDAVSSATAQTYKGFASAPGFAAHGDVAFANAEVDAEGNLVALEINEYYGIRSVGRIVNNLEKAKDAELQKVNEIDDQDKVYSEDGKYVSYKYLMIDGRYFECEDSGANLYKEIGEGASIDDLQTYLQENTDWWCEAMASAAETGATLKVAAEGEEVLAEIDGVKLAKMDELHSFYGGLTKREGYTVNFNKNSGKTTDWADSADVLTQYILDNGFTDELIADVNADTTDKYLDLVSGATFGYPSLYVNVAQAAVENALASK